MYISLDQWQRHQWDSRGKKGLRPNCVRKIKSWGRGAGCGAGRGWTSSRNWFNKSLERQGFFTLALGPRLALGLLTVPLHREEVVTLRQTHQEVGSGWRRARAGGQGRAARCLCREWGVPRNQQRKLGAIGLILSAQNRSRPSWRSGTGNPASSLVRAVAGGSGVCSQWLYIHLRKQPKLQSSLGSGSAAENSAAAERQAVRPGTAGAQGSSVPRGTGTDGWGQRPLASTKATVIYSDARSSWKGPNWRVLSVFCHPFFWTGYFGPGLWRSLEVMIRKRIAVIGEKSAI